MECDAMKARNGNLQRMNGKQFRDATMTPLLWIGRYNFMKE